MERRDVPQTTWSVSAIACFNRLVAYSRKFSIALKSAQPRIAGLVR